MKRASPLRPTPSRAVPAPAGDPPARGLVPRFRAHGGGNVAMITALVLPPLFGLFGIAVDMSTWYATKARMQAAADAAAIASAQELRVANATPGQVSRVAEGYVAAQLLREGEGPAAVTAAVTGRRDHVQVDVALNVQGTFTRFLSDRFTTIAVRSVARLSGSTPICLVGLDEGAKSTVHLDDTARVTANGCAIYSDSRDKHGLTAEKDAVVGAALICSAGGIKFNKKANFEPQPVPDCPAIPDPLSARQAPSMVGCSANNLVIRENRVLKPGVYCGGLQVTDGAQARLDPGIYVIKDGPLIVDGNGALLGENTGFYFSGALATLFFDSESTISLTAPKDGVMAGLLFSEERAIPASSGAMPPAEGPKPKKAPKERPSPGGGGLREHRILSDNARVLLGTIYLPASRLVIDSSRDVAGGSAYTVVVVRRLELYEGPNLILNSNYAASDIPVPDGLGPRSGTVSLAQ